MLTHTIRSTIDTRREDYAAWAGDYGPYAQQASVSADVWYHLTGRLAYALRQVICRYWSHQIIDCSTAGPDHGNMDAECTRCGEYWRGVLY